MIRRSHFLLGLALATFVLAGSNSAYAADPATARIQRLLLAVHAPPSAAQLRAASPDAPAILRRLARSDGDGRWYRDRALAALAHFPSPATEATLQSVLRDEAVAPTTRGHALRALGRVHPDRVVELIAPFLRSRHPDLRSTAAHALADLKSPAARARLRSEAAATSDRALAETIRRRLARP